LTRCRRCRTLHVTTRLPPGSRAITQETALAQTPPHDIAQIQQTALLDTTLAIIIRVATEMQDDLRRGEINLGRADQLGHAALTTLKKAAVIADRVETTTRSVA
jgi:hypothetical protein